MLTLCLTVDSVRQRRKQLLAEGSAILPACMTCNTCKSITVFMIITDDDNTNDKDNDINSDSNFR